MSHSNSFEDGDDQKLQEKNKYVLPPPATSSGSSVGGLGLSNDVNSNDENIKTAKIMKKSTSVRASGESPMPAQAPAPIQQRQQQQPEDSEAPLTPPLSPVTERNSDFEPAVAGTNKRQLRQLIKGQKEYQRVLQEEERVEAERIKIAIQQAKAASKYEKKFAGDPIKAQKLLERARSEEYKCKSALAEATLRFEKAKLETQKRQDDLDAVLSHLESLTTETGGKLDTVEGLRRQKSAADINRQKRHSMAQQTMERARGSLKGR